MMPQKVEEPKPKIDNTECLSEESDSDSNSKKNDKSAHPWGGSASKAVMKSETEPASVVSEPSQPLKYVAPGMRGGDSGRTPMKQIKKAPNIANNSEFPSLSEVADIDTEDGTWSRVNKNGHVKQPKPVEPTVVKKPSTIPAAKRDVIVVESASMSAGETKSKYVPPHIRKQNENRFAGLKDNQTR